MNITITGVINAIFPAEIVGQNFEKRLVWIDEKSDSQWPNTWEVEFQQGNCNKVDNFSAGQLVEVKINLRGRMLQKRNNGDNFVINTLAAWDIKLAQTQQPQQQYSQPQQQQQAQQRPNNPPPQQYQQQPQQNNYQQQNYNQPTQQGYSGNFNQNNGQQADDLPF